MRLSGLQVEASHIYTSQKFGLLSFAVGHSAREYQSTVLKSRLGVHTSVTLHKVRYVGENAPSRIDMHLLINFSGVFYVLHIRTVTSKLHALEVKRILLRFRTGRCRHRDK